MTFLGGEVDRRRAKSVRMPWSSRGRRDHVRVKLEAQANMGAEQQQISHTQVNQGSRSLLKSPFYARHVSAVEVAIDNPIISLNLELRSKRVDLVSRDHDTRQHSVDIISSDFEHKE